MFKKLILFCVVSLFIIQSSAAFSAVSAEHGVYLEGNAGIGAYSEHTFSLDMTSAIGMANLNLGYKFNKNFALEVGAADFANFETNFFGFREDVSSYYFDVAFKGIIPFDSGFELFGKLGGAYIHTTNTLHIEFLKNSSIAKSVTEPVGLLGIGVGYSFTPSLSASIQGVLTSSNDDAASTKAVTVGLAYIFA